MRLRWLSIKLPISHESFNHSPYSSDPTAADPSTASLRLLAAPLGTTHLGAQLRERFDEHRRLDGHVQTAGDARALERLRRTVLLTERHETGHLVLGHDDLLATPFGQLDVGCRQRAVVRLESRAAGSVAVTAAAALLLTAEDISIKRRSNGGNVFWGFARKTITGIQQHMFFKMSNE